MRNLCAALILIFIFPAVSFAQSDSGSFIINLNIGDSAPTAPTLLSAEAVAPNQVDITWSAATDDNQVVGYVVYRDGLAIASTSQLSYSDNGVVGETSYSYYVVAFDSGGNYSIPSNVLNVTTGAESTDGGGSTRTNPSLEEVNISTGLSTANFEITTDRPARFELRFGRTADYELGYITTGQYKEFYSTTLTDLEPGTTYQYELSAYSLRGDLVILKSGQFTTEEVDNIFPPPNVSDFSGLPTDSGARLSWQLPEIDDLQYVRIVRSHFGLPTHLNDGAVIYQGWGTEAVDVDVFKNYSTVYYTAFVVNESGLVSSGAVVILSKEGEVPPPLTEREEGIEVFEEGENIRIPGLDEISIIQNNLTQTFLDASLQLSANQSFVISVPKSAVANTLKTLLVTFTDPSDFKKEYSYILRLNNKGTAYEAVIGAVDMAGNSWFTARIYNFESRTVSTYTKNIFFIGEETIENNIFEFSDLLKGIVTLFGVLILISGLLWFLIKIIRSKLTTIDEPS